MSQALPNLRIPYALSVTAEQAKLLAQFLDFKLYNPQGRLTPKDYGNVKKLRVSNRYWLEKLVNAGWAYRDGKAYCLRSYDYVWGALGIHKTRGHRHRGYHTKFYKLNPEDFDLEKKVYIKQIINQLLKRTASNKVRRMLHKKRTHYICQSSDESLEFFGVRKAAKLFGFKSPATGLKYRKKYFTVVPSDRRLRRTDNREYAKWTAEFLYEADKIAL